MDMEKRKLPTHIDAIDDEMANVIRSKSGSERLAIANGMYASARRMLLCHLRTEHPDWDEHHVNVQAARRLSHGAI